MNYKINTLNPTEQYKLENEYVNGLNKRILTGAPRKRYISIYLRFFLWTYRALKNIIVYAKELITFHRNFGELLRLKSIKSLNDAIVIGNGPSQGYLSVKLLNSFRRNGGEVFVVNFWHLNLELSEFCPDYLVISDPATLSFSAAHESLLEKNKTLLSYLVKHSNIKIICPFSRTRDLERLFEKKRIICFSDTELIGLSTNIMPIYPRGYISMTLYKALAMALWFGYKRVFIIGMDNTYPRNIYCDKNNKILNLEIHSGNENSVVDQSAIYRNIGELLEDLSTLFKDAFKFAEKKDLINLDQYSLTDAFPKITITEFEEEMYKSESARATFIK
jgi:hypothetical protein